MKATMNGLVMFLLGLQSGRETNRDRYLSSRSKEIKFRLFTELFCIFSCN